MEIIIQNSRFDFETILTTMDLFRFNFSIYKFVQERTEILPEHPTFIKYGNIFFKTHLLQMIK